MQFVPAVPVLLGPCNKTVILPCVVTNLRLNKTKAMHVKWKLHKNEFFSFDGFDGKTFKDKAFQSAAFLDFAKLVQGVASLTLNRSEAVEGTYECEVVESNREGLHQVVLKYTPGKLLVLFFCVGYWNH